MARKFATDLAHGQSVACDDVSGMDLVLDQLVGALQQLRREDDHRGGAVPHLGILKLSKLHQNLQNRNVAVGLRLV